VSGTRLAAEALGARLPPLLIESERVAATVAQGLHGRRRVGTGENFWQFRPFVAGDAASRVDWRRSARSDQVYLRETEWDAAQTVALWREAGPAMGWRSAPSLPHKAERAELLLLALASLILRGGERVRLLDGTNANAAGVTSGSAALTRLADALTRSTQGLPGALPPAQGRMVLLGDWLGELAPVTALLARLAALPVRGALVQVLDPAEVELPYEGRVRFVSAGDARQVTIPRVEAVRAAYQAKLAERQQALAVLCRSAGFTLILHRTDTPPHAALRHPGCWRRWRCCRCCGGCCG
jgi:uncharacterized protein (DUF58 family)